MLENIKLKDDFTVDEISENAHHLKDVLDRFDEVVIDATGVRRVDTAALQMLVAAQKECSENGKTLTFKVSPEMAHLLSLTGIHFDT